MPFRDRVTELRRVRAGDLAPHPHNWRTHPKRQRDAMLGVLEEVGYADAVVARELSGGALQLIDGHLRAETTPDAVVPVLVVDLDDSETEKILLTHDPIGGMAGADSTELAGLLTRVETESEAIGQMLDRLAEKSGAIDLATLADRDSVEIPESYQVVVECRDAEQQQTVFEQMREEGFRCRVLTL